MTRDQALLSIGEVAKRFRTTLRALRFYEDIGLLHPRKTMARDRLYTEDDALRVEFILRMQRFGYALKEVKRILTGYPNGILPRLTQAQIDLQLRVLETRRNQLNAAIEELKAQEAAE